MAHYHNIKSNLIECIFLVDSFRNVQDILSVPNVRSIYAPCPGKKWKILDAVLKADQINDYRNSRAKINFQVTDGHFSVWKKGCSVFPRLVTLKTKPYTEDGS